MIIHAEISEEGILKVTDPELHGKAILLTFSEQEEQKPVGKTNWDSMWSLFQEADRLDIPRRSHDEIIRDLHTFRENGS